jgi:hypothetical protein
MAHDKDESLNLGKPAYVTDGQTKGINKRWTKPPIVMKVAVTAPRASIRQPEAPIEPVYCTVPFMRHTRVPAVPRKYRPAMIPKFLF